MPPKPFSEDVIWPLQPSGAFFSFDSGPLQGRIYRNSGHIEVAGPDLAGNPLANVVRFAPPAIQTDKGSLFIGGAAS